ncbi:MAG: SGNH/GDSL hydrolase family protein [Planctomycetota bacterium]
MTERITPSLRRVTTLAAFTIAGVLLAAPVPASNDAVIVRGDLSASQRVFEKGRGVVAFLGGSITEMEGYRVYIAKSLRQRFPKTEFEFLNAGVASTCSHTGAFRLREEVLAKEPDLLFVEFAVNDDQDAAHDEVNAMRGMEGIVRGARLEHPEVDIVVTHFVNRKMLEQIQNDGVPLSVRAHESVAAHYNVSSCNVGLELANRIERGSMSWETYGGVHPGDPGNRLAASLVERVFDANNYRSGETESVRSGKKVIPIPLDTASFSEGRMLSLESVNKGKTWARSIPEWSAISGKLRSRFGGLPMLHTTIDLERDEPNTDFCEVRFRGTAVGLYALAGPDAGSIEFSVDGGGWETKSLYHRFSKGLHYPRTIVLVSDLENGPHTVRFRAIASSPTRNSVRILRVVCNGEAQDASKSSSSK